MQDGKWVLADQSVTSATRGDGCVYTSLEDYLKWLGAHANRKLLSAESHDAMFSPQAKTTRDDSSYGYGWFLDEYRGEPRIQHNGDSRGFRLCVQTFPERQAAVVLQFNGNVKEGDDEGRRADVRHPDFRSGDQVTSLGPTEPNVARPRKNVRMSLGAGRSDKMPGRNVAIGDSGFELVTRARRGRQIW